MTNDDDFEPAVVDLVMKLRLLLAGNHPTVVGAALGDLVSTFIAGHIVPGNKHDTKALQQQMLEFHVKLVKQLIPEAAKEIKANAANLPALPVHRTPRHV